MVKGNRWVYNSLKRDFIYWYALLSCKMYCVLERNQRETTGFSVNVRREIWRVTAGFLVIARRNHWVSDYCPEKPLWVSDYCPERERETIGFLMTFLPRVLLYDRNWWVCSLVLPRIICLKKWLGFIWFTPLRETTGFKIHMVLESIIIWKGLMSFWFLSISYIITKLQDVYWVLERNQRETTGFSVNVRREIWRVTAGFLVIARRSHWVSDYCPEKPL